MAGRRLKIGASDETMDSMKQRERASLNVDSWMKLIRGLFSILKVIKFGQFSNANSLISMTLDGIQIDLIAVCLKAPDSIVLSFEFGTK